MTARLRTYLLPDLLPLSPLTDFLLEASGSGTRTVCVLGPCVCVCVPERRLPVKSCLSLTAASGFMAIVNQSFG